MLIALLGAGVTCAVAIRVLAPLALATGWVDRPDSRKRHIGSVPLIGGVAIFVGCTAGGLIMPTAHYQPALWLTGGLLMLLGAIDDRLGVSAWHRLGAQIALSSAMFICSPSGISVINDTERGVAEASLMAGLVVFMAVATINAINLADGIDMLAGSIAVVAGLGALWLAPGLAQVVPITLAVATLLPFLASNAGWIGPRIFLGDAGSTLLGHILFWSTVALSDPWKADSLLTPVWCMAVPIFDMAAVSLHRMTTGASPLAPDRSHLHHLLHDLGLGKRQIVGIIVSLSITLIALGGWSQKLPSITRLAILFGAGIVYLIVIRKLRLLAYAQIATSRIHR